MPKAIARVTTAPARPASRRASYDAAAVNSIVLLFQPAQPSKAQRIAAMLHAAVAALPARASIPSHPREAFHPVRDMPRCGWYGQHRPDGCEACLDCGEAV